jgi:hypothetical protein
MRPKEKLPLLCRCSPRAVADYRRYGVRVTTKNDARTCPAANGQRRASGVQRVDGAGRADYRWFPMGLARKSLIVERTAAITYRRFATSCKAFAISVIFSLAAAAPLSSLSIALKKKKKESEEDVEQARTARHELKLLCHQSRALPIFWAMGFRPLPVVSHGI